MKKLIFLFCFLPGFAIAQPSLVDFYEAKEFKCDELDGTVNANICSGEKVAFVDSLLNNLYNKIIKNLDKEIVSSKQAILKLRKKVKYVDSSDLYYTEKKLKYDQNLRDAIVFSQRNWIKLRNSNISVEALLCEGGTGCIAITNEALIKEILDRIRKLESYSLY